MMKHFQVLVVVLLLMLVVEVGMIDMRMPTPEARAASSGPVPVVITDPGMFNCPFGHSCAEVYGGSVAVRGR
jgi:hypothetical protein